MEPVRVCLRKWHVVRRVHVLRAFVRHGGGRSTGARPEKFKSFYPNQSVDTLRRTGTEVGYRPGSIRILSRPVVGTRAGIDGNIRAGIAYKRVITSTSA